MWSSLFLKKNLYFRIAIGFFVGIFTGIFFPVLSKNLKFLGDIYLNLIKMMIVPIIFFSVTTGILNLGDRKEFKRIGFKTIFLFVFMFLASSAVSLLVAYAIQPGHNLILENTPTYTGELTTPSAVDFFSNIVPSNIIDAMAKGNILSVILFSALFAIASVSIEKESQKVRELLQSFSSVFFKILDYVMETSPLGVAALMAYSIAEYGEGIFTALSKYILTAYLACIAVFIVVILVPTLVYTKISFKRFISGLFKIWLVTLSTTSSAAALPTSLKISKEEYLVPEEISNFVLPLGCTINMCGGAASFCCLAVFVSGFYNITFSFEQIVYFVIIATLINMGAPGIPGGGIILGASFLSIIGLPFDLMGPIAAFYRLLDMAFTTMNVTGDIAANLLIAKSEEKHR